MNPDNEELHPNIQRRVFFNPGTGPVSGATESNAANNMVQFLMDAKISGLTMQRSADEDYGDGRYSFDVTWKGVTINVQMPGLELEHVRFMGQDDQNIWDFPRLYVHHGSWVWQYAILDWIDFYDEDIYEYNMEHDRITRRE